MLVIKEVHISFAFAHQDPSKRPTWKAGRGITLQKALATMADEPYNHWRPGEWKAIQDQFKCLGLRNIKPINKKRSQVTEINN